MAANDTLNTLVACSRRLGDPALDYVILGEGNTSARIDAETFWVKAGMRQVLTWLDDGKSVLIPDTRFPNECQAILDHGGDSN